jgi:integrase
MSEYTDQVDVRGDGRVILYKRPGLKAPKWQVRIRVPKSTGYRIVSTKTADRREAERFALDLYEELYLHVKSGGTIQSRTFKQVFEEWQTTINTMGHTRQGGSWDATVHRIESYAVKFFGQMKIDSIGPLQFADFWVWRKSNFNRTKPSNGTLRRERTSILPVFKFAVTRGYLQSVPDTDPPKAALERRPTFTLDEWRTIYTAARSWVNEGEAKATWRQRFVSQQYILVLANTGLRVGELRGLRWSDLRTVSTNDGTRLIGEVRGKTGSREVVFQDGAEVYIKRIYDLRIDETADAPPSDEVIFCHRDGIPIHTMKTAFNSLLKYAGVPIERNGGSRTLYSLRHFYATMRLSNDTSPFLLAKQMGTSVEMLEKYYGQTISSELAAQISKAGRTKEPTTKKDKAYPFD